MCVDNERDIQMSNCLKKYIVAFDQGTTSSRAIVLDHDANVVSIAQKNLPRFIRSLAGSSMTLWKFGLRKVLCG